MKSIATIKLKIPQKEEFLETMKQYSYSAQKVIDFGWNIKTFNKVELHNLTYYKLRKETELPAQLICSSKDKAIEVLKSCKFKNSKPVMKEYLTIRYDARSFSFKCNKEIYYVSLSTIKGRIKIPIDIPEYYWRYLDWKVCSADLIFDRKDRMFLNIVFSKEQINYKISNGVLGVDIGINNIAVTSDKRFFNARQIKRKKLMFKRLKSKLQAKGTRGAKRRLKSLSGKEKRFMTWVNHNISKQIVSCKEGTIVMENLKGIRKKSKGKKLNYWLHSWSFYQLQRFVKYKATREGKDFFKVSPINTSKTCSNCGNIGTRVKSFFKCIHCDYSLNADLNASFNLAKHNSISDCVSADVNQPHLICDEAE